MIRLVAQKAPKLNENFYIKIGRIENKVSIIILIC